MSERFYESPPWRFVITNLSGAVLTFLDKRCHDRQIYRGLNEPLRINGTVPSDDPEIFGTSADGDPTLHEGNRLVYCFRRENDAGDSSNPIWVIRAAGVVLTVDDRGGPDTAVTDFEANDPWQYLYKRPVRAGDGSLPGPEGLSFNASGSLIAEQLIAFSELVDGPTRLDLLTGTIETTDVVEIDFQQGSSLGEALDSLCDTGTMDIVMEPMYDPVNKPGILCELNIFARAGSIRREAIFAWDKPSRSLVDLARQRDGNQRANKLQYYVGQGGPAVPLKTDAGSVSSYGQYWEQQFFPSQMQADTVEKTAEQQRKLRKYGLTTYTMSPAPERSPIPFVDYDIGDSVPIYASQQLREPVAAVKRIYAIPLLIGDDQMEAPAQIVISEDEDPED